MSREEEGDGAPSSCGMACRFLAATAALLLTRLASDMFCVLCDRGSGSGDGELAEGWEGQQAHPWKLVRQQRGPWCRQGWCAGELAVVPAPRLHLLLRYLDLGWVRPRLDMPLVRPGLSFRLLWGVASHWAIVIRVGVVLVVKWQQWAQPVAPIFRKSAFLYCHVPHSTPAPSHRCPDLW